MRSFAVLLLDVEPNEVTYPLAQFQQTRFEKEDLRRLVHSINKAVLGDGGRSLPEPVLDRLFDRNWDRLNTAITAAMRIVERDDAGDIDIVEEMIGVVLLSRSPAATTIEDLVPAVLQAISSKMPPQPPAMLATLAGQFERKLYGQASPPWPCRGRERKVMPDQKWRGVLSRTREQSEGISDANGGGRQNARWSITAQSNR